MTPERELSVRSCPNDQAVTGGEEQKNAGEIIAGGSLDKKVEKYPANFFIVTGNPWHCFNPNN